MILLHPALSPIAQSSAMNPIHLATKGFIKTSLEAKCRRFPVQRLARLRSRARVSLSRSHLAR